MINLNFLAIILKLGLIVDRNFRNIRDKRFYLYQRKYRRAFL